MATLSVIMPNYNHAHYLSGALCALTSQSRPADELIVIDDASTDESVAIIEMFARQFSSIKVICKTVNEGPLQTSNRGLCEAHGDYIYWASADDRVLPGFFEQSMEILENYPQAALCFSNPATFVSDVDEITENYFRLGRDPLFIEPAKLIAYMRLRRLHIAHHTAPVKTAALENAGLELDLRWHADWFAILVMAFRYGACYVPRTLAAHRISPQSYSRAANRMPEQQCRIYQRMLELLETAQYADVAEAFRESLVLSTYGVQMWRLMAQDVRWAKYRTPKFLKTVILDQMVARLAACSPRTQRSLSRMVNAWRERSAAGV